MMNKNSLLKYSYINNIKVLTYSDNSKILVKTKKKYNLEKIYNYLDSHNFNNYLKPLKITDREVYFQYLPKVLLDNDERAKKLVYNLSVLQNKTTTYKEIDRDRQKEDYDKLKNKILYLENYYFTLQDTIENKVYMSPSEYLFIRNVSIIYQALNFSKEILEKWYKIVKEKTTERFVYCHGKCELAHFLCNDEGYFISLENAHLGKPTEDFLYFFNKNYKDTDMLSNFRFYQHRFHYKEEELLYFIVNLVIPKKIDIYKSSLKKCMELTDYFDKLKVTSNFVLEYQKNHQHYEQH